MISKDIEMFGLSAVFAGITLNFEPYGRQSEIALFTLNKSMETTYHLLTRRKWPIRICYGECLLMGVAMSILCFHYLNHRDAFRSNYLTLLDALLNEA